MIGVLAIQGDFAAHGRVLQRLGVRWCEVRRPEQMAELSGLILPGGESTTMLKFLLEEGLIEPLKEFARRGGSFFGTCAGTILLAKEVVNPTQPSLGLVDISVERNAYGRQVDSFIDSAMSRAFGPPPLEMVFIRAPMITKIGRGVEVLAEHSGRPVLVQQGNHLVATFHPELTDDRRVHERFLSLIGER
jgi:5'-phosphate synthase pdxT subunit